MIDKLSQSWSSLWSPTYHRLTAHSRNGSLDTSVEELRLKDTIRALRRWLLALAVLLTICLLALGRNIALQIKDESFRASPVPRFPSKLVAFTRNDTFASRADATSDKAWNDLLPLGNGLVVVDDPVQYALEPGMSSKVVSEKLYNLAVFHQLHCLTSIREYLWHMKFAADQNKTEQLRPILLDPEEDHVLDCFDYLRQSLMCSGDTTLEWPRQEQNGKQGIIDGWDIPRSCVDWDALLDFVAASLDAFV